MGSQCILDVGGHQRCDGKEDKRLKCACTGFVHRHKAESYRVDAKIVERGFMIGGELSLKLLDC